MMNQLTLEEATNRLLSLEQRVALLSTQVPATETTPGNHLFEYVISVNGQEMWSGQELEKPYQDIRLRYPKADIMINWRLHPSVTLV